MSINKVILIGNLGNDPELKIVSSGTKMARASLATTSSWKDKNTGEKQEQTEWHKLVLFNRQAEIIDAYASKGDKIYIEGSLKTRKWVDSESITRYITEVSVRELQLLSSSRSNTSINNDKGGSGDELEEFAF